jgi:outer membrane protein assembly factor BamB
MLVIGMMLLASAASADDWPGWLGPGRSGVSAEKGWNPKALGGGAKVLWQKEVGVGFASVAIIDGRLYTVGNDKGTDTIWCLDAGDGKVIWKHSYACDPGQHPGPCATPTVDGERVYVFSRQGHLYGLHAIKGDVLWSVDVRKDLNAKSGRWGYSSSPLVFEDKLILQTGAADGTLTAFDKTTGQVIWNADGGVQAYASPIPFEQGGRTVILLLAGKSLRAFDPADGKLLWQHPWTDAQRPNSATMPVVSGSRIFISTDYCGGAAVIDLSTGRPRSVWKNKRMNNITNNTVLHDGHLYGFDADRGKKPFLRCLDFATGEERWSDDTLGNGALTIAGGRLIVMSDKGELVIAEATPEAFRPISRARVLEGLCWTIPVLVDGRIYCRSHPGKLVCVDARK